MWPSGNFWVFCTTSLSPRAIKCLGDDMQNKKISVEIYPYKREKNNKILVDKLKDFQALRLKFISVTYGASGAIQNSTLGLLDRLSLCTSLNLAAHLTCINSTKNFVKNILSSYWDKNIKNIIALGGDIPKCVSQSDYTYAIELIKDIKDNNNFDVSVAFHPEGHPKDKDISAELENLKKKIFYGANQAISQFFFNEEYFLRFRDKFFKKNKNFKLIPGIILVSNFEMIERFAIKCKSEVPRKTKEYFLAMKNPQNIPEKYYIEYAAKQCERLKSEGVQDFHIYSLNKLDSTLKLIKEINPSERKDATTF